MDQSQRPEFLRYQRFANAKINRDPYALYLEPDLRGILVELEKINKSYFTLNHNLLRAWLAPGCWKMWLGEAADGHYAVYGLIVPPKMLRTPFVVKADGRVLDEFVHPVPSFVDDLIYTDPQRHFGFTAKLKCPPLESLDRPIRLTCEAASGAMVFPEHTDFWLLPSDDPLPSPENMKRVGAASHSAYILDGSTFYGKLDGLTRRYLGKPLDDVAPVLDWGVGCGKMVRYFPKQRRKTVSGADIDPVNIQWCGENIAGASFSAIKKQPPTKLPASHFELIYGNSVFTHLREQDQFLWLNELRRIVKPDGLVAVTIHGNFSFALLGWFEAYSLLTLLNNGMRVAESYNPDLGDFGKDIYYDVAHNPQYVIDRWSEYFEVLDILEGYSFGELAMVILRKK
ncbi:MAG: class I SAM-dependent methyltransferase [Pirellulales bacterium]|nr:class I SAM-dependent methyltransferase [Pirellulales bacterium]